MTETPKQTQQEWIDANPKLVAGINMTMRCFVGRLPADVARDLVRFAVQSAPAPPEKPIDLLGTGVDC